MEWGRALEDCEKCLQLDPKFIKAYIRLGKVQHFLKQYHKAVETYEKGNVNSLFILSTELTVVLAQVSSWMQRMRSS